METQGMTEQAQELRGPAAGPAFAAEAGRSAHTGNLAGVLASLAVVTVAAVVAGAAAHFIARWAYVMLALPVAVGLAVGLAGAWAARRFRIHTPTMFAAGGLLAAVAAMGAMHCLDFRDFRHDIDAQASQWEPAKLIMCQLTPEQFATYLRRMQFMPEQEETARLVYKAYNATTLWSYLDFQAAQGAQGLRIKRPSGTIVLLNLGYAGTWINWIAELLLVAAIMYWLMRSARLLPRSGRS